MSGKNKPKESPKVKGTEKEKEKEKEKEDSKKDLENKGSNPLFDSLIQQVTGLLALIVTDQDGVILLKTYSASFSSQLEKEKLSASASSSSSSSSSSTTSFPATSTGSDDIRETVDDDEESGKLNDTEEEDGEERVSGGSGSGGDGPSRPPSASGGALSSSHPKEYGASNFSTAFTVAIQQAHKLNIGQNKYITAFYKNRTIIHVNYEPLIITLVAGPMANIGLILSRIVPDLKAKLEPVKRSVQESIASEKENEGGGGPTVRENGFGGGGGSIAQGEDRHKATNGEGVL